MQTYGSASSLHRLAAWRIAREQEAKLEGVLCVELELETGRRDV